MCDPAGLARCGSAVKMQSVRYPVGDPSIEHRRTDKRSEDLLAWPEANDFVLHALFRRRHRRAYDRGRKHLTHVLCTYSYLIIRNQFLISLSYHVRLKNDRSHNSQYKQSTSIMISDPASLTGSSQQPVGDLDRSCCWLAAGKGRCWWFKGWLHIKAEQADRRTGTMRRSQSRSEGMSWKLNKNWGINTSAFSDHRRLARTHHLARASAQLSNKWMLIRIDFGMDKRYCPTNRTLD